MISNRKNNWTSSKLKAYSSEDTVKKIKKRQDTKLKQYLQNIYLRKRFVSTIYNGHFQDKITQKNWVEDWNNHLPRRQINGK